MLGDSVAPQVQGEQISGDAHARDLRPFQTWAERHQAIVKEALALEKAYVEAVMKKLLDGEPVALRVTCHVDLPVTRHGSNVLSKKP
jgi:hypothetical protein